MTYVLGTMGKWFLKTVGLYILDFKLLLSFTLFKQKYQLREFLDGFITLEQLRKYVKMILPISNEALYKLLNRYDELELNDMACIQNENYLDNTAAKFGSY